MPLHNFRGRRKVKFGALLLVLLAFLGLPASAPGSVHVAGPQWSDEVVVRSLEVAVDAQESGGSGESALWTGATSSPMLQTAGQFRDSSFYAVVRATLSARVAPRRVRFRLRRESTGETESVLGQGVARNLEGTTVYEAQWNMTRHLGVWRVTLEGAQSAQGEFRLPNRARALLRIDKRQQIVQLARYWARKGLQSSNQKPLFSACDGFVSTIYKKLGLPAPMFSNSGRVVEDEGEGAMCYFFSEVGRSTSLTPDHAVHVALRSGFGSVIDNNWGNSGQGPREHLGVDALGTYYSWSSRSFSPRDPRSPGRSLLDSA